MRAASLCHEGCQPKRNPLRVLGPGQEQVRALAPPEGRPDCPGTRRGSLCGESTELPGAKSRAGDPPHMPVATQRDPVGGISEPLGWGAIFRKQKEPR